MHNTKQESDGKGSEALSSKPKQRVRAARRPRLLPVPVRQKLSQLGLAPSSNETSRDNLSVIIDRLTTDLSNYRQLAEHWQQKYIDLKNDKRGDSSSSGSLESHSGFDEVCGIYSSSPSYSTDEMSSISTHLVGKLDSTANPSLSLVALGAPRVHSDVSRVVSESTFRAALAAIEIMSSLHAKPAPCDMNADPRIILVKPDFDNQKAFQIWNHIFEPMSFQPTSVLFNSAPSCRREIEYDSDMDHFDRVLALSSDLEIVDMLQYATLLIGGMHQIVFDDPSKASARIHIGRSVERILREAVFTRNLTANPAVAKVLLDGLVGSFCHFATQDMASAVLSVVHLAWLVFSQNIERFHPTNRIFISFYALVLEPSESQRKIWMQRVNEGLELSEPEKPFLAVLMAAFAGAYNALLGKDEAGVLQYIASLDEILAPLTESNEQAEQYEIDHFHAVYAKPPSTGLQSPPSTQSPSYTESTDYYDPADLTYNFENDDNLLADWLTPPLSSEETSEPLMPADEWIESSSAFLDEYGRTFTPGENLKSIFRIPLQLIRADAALAIQDLEMCMYWVDEAEKTMLSVPLNYMMQRVFLMKNVIKTTCPFPTGERSVVDEFERRMLAHDSAQSGRPSGEHGRVGALWRTP